MKTTSFILDTNRIELIGFNSLQKLGQQLSEMKQGKKVLLN